MYTASEDSNGVASFDRDPSTGVLSQRGCVFACQTDGGVESCQSGTALVNSYGVALSPDDANAYVAGNGSAAVAVFDRDTGVCLTTTTTTTSTTLSTTTTIAEPTTTTTSTTTTTTTEPTTTTTMTPPTDCPPTPRTDCRGAGGGHTRTTIRGSGTSTARKIQFAWQGGEVTPLAAFGDPVAGDATTHLCLYDSSAVGQPLSHIIVPPGGICHGRPCWSRVDSRGFRYFDRTAANGGVRRISLRSSGTGIEKPRVFVKSLAAATPLPTLPLVPPVTAQVVVVTAGGDECWEAVYAGARANRPERFDAATP